MLKELITLFPSRAMIKSLLAKSASFLAACAMVLTPVSSQTSFASDTVEKRIAVTRLATKLGPRMAKQILVSTKLDVPSSSLSPEQRSQAVENMVKDYAKMRSSFASARNAGEWSSIGVGGAFGIVAAVAGPQAAVTIPAMIVGAVLTTAIDIGNDKMDEAGLNLTRKLLKSRQQEILQETGLTYEQLAADPESAKAVFANGVAVLNDLKDRAEGDDLAWKNTQELLVGTLVNTTKAQWDAIETNQNNLAEVADFVTDMAFELAEFERDINSRFQIVEQRFDRVESAIGELGDAVVHLDGRVGKLERDQAVISDFVLDQMPPALKVIALRDKGFLAEKFACKPGEESCEASQLKGAMIARFEKEAEVQELVSDITKAGNILGNVGTIANNLGIGSPELNRVVEVGTIAANAFIGFASGNYIGAIASLTGLFAKKKNPDAERFKILMKYLGRQFKQVNAKLDKVLDNQVKLMNAINRVHVEMRESFQRIDRTLARMEFEQNRMSSGIRALIWNDWKTCYAVFDEAMDRNAGGQFKNVDPNTLYFLSETRLNHVLSVKGESVLPCLITMQANMASLNATERFGNFVDLKWVLDERLTETAAIAEDNPKEWRGRLQRFENDIFNPARIFFNRSVADTNSPDMASHFAMLTRPMSTTDEWRAGTEQIRMHPFKCYDVKNPNLRHGQLLCRSGQSANQTAVNLLARPILADVVNDISDWVLIMSQFADIRDQSKGEWLTYSALFELAAEDKLPLGKAAGEDLIQKSISVVDVAIASYALTYGPTTASKVLDEMLDSGANAEQAFQLASNNSFLRANIAQILLERRYKNSQSSLTGGKPKESVYRTSYGMAVSGIDAPFFLIKGLFGEDLEYFVAEDGTPMFGLNTKHGKLEMELPATSAMIEGRLHWPPRYYELLATREQLADRLFNYKLLDGLDPSYREGAALVLTQ